MITDDPGARPVEGRSSDEPSWLRALVVVPATGVAAFGGAGLALALVGSYRPALSVILGLPFFVMALRWLRPVLVSTVRPNPSAHAVAAVGVAVVAAITVWNVANAAEHVLINRDPGVYANAARWLASDGDLRVDPVPDAVVDRGGVRASSFGMYDAEGGSLEFQFAHLLPVVLAQAHRLGGDVLLFATPALLGGVALLAFLLVAWRLTRHPVLAVVTTVAFGLSMPQVAFARDTYSEILGQLLLFTVIWLVQLPEGVTSVRVAAVAGALAGMVQATRIDALSGLVALPVLFAVLHVVARRSGRASPARAALAFAGGAVPGLLLGGVDLVVLSGDYFDHLSGEVRALVAATSLSVVVAFAFAVVASRWRLRTVLPRVAVAWGAGIVVAAAGIYGWLVRPHVEVVRGAVAPYIEGLQRLEGVAPDPTLRYYDRSLEWMQWYLGPVVVAVAIAGAAMLATRIVARPSAPMLAPVVVLGPSAVLYLYKASAFQDHIWVMRRFLLGALPLLLLSAAFVTAWIWRRGRLGCVAAVVVAIFAVGHPLAAISDVPRLTEQDGYAAVIDDACHLVGPRAAVVVLVGDDLFHEWVPQTLRSWCGAQVVVAADPGAAELEDMGAEWSGRERDVWVAASKSETILAALPGARLAATRTVDNEHQLERTLTRRPSGYQVASFGFVVAPLEPVG